MQNAWSIIWHTVSLSMTLVKRQPYHPGADIAMDFMGWGLNWGMGIVVLIWVSYTRRLSDECDNTASYYYDASLCSEKEAADGIQLTAGALCVLVGYVSSYRQSCIVSFVC